MRAAVLIVAAVGLLGAGMSRAQVRHAWSVAPSLRLGLAPPRARHTVALDAHGARRRLDAASQRRAEARGRSFGEALPLTNVSIAEAGEWETLHDGSRLWRLVLSCPGASSVHFFSDAFELLPGDRLYVHGGGRVGTRGAYSEANNAPHRTFASPPMPGDELHLELHETARADGARTAANGVDDAGVDGAGVDGASPSTDGADAGTHGGRRLLELTLLVAGTTPLFSSNAWQRATGRSSRASRGQPPPFEKRTRRAHARDERARGTVAREKGESSASAVRLASWVSGSGACMVNERCEVGRRWEAQAAGVAAIVEHHTASICTGTLINSLGSGKPRQLFITAYHCVRSRVEEAGFDPRDNFLPWSFLFNWQSDACATNDVPGGRGSHVGGIDTVYGASIRAYGNDTDFALLEVHEQIPPEFNVHYAGWDATSARPNMSLIIHHPTSDLKKISIDYDPPKTWSFGGDDYYQIIFGERRVWASPHWFIERYEVGSTEGGSSGGPLFNWDGRLVGVLHGGYADCHLPKQDWYGKLVNQWDEQRKWFQQGPHGSLSRWLDPEGTGVRLTDGAWHAPHAHTLRANAAVELGASALTFARASGQQRRVARALSVSLLAPPTASVLVSVRIVDGDGASGGCGCFVAEPSQLLFEAAEWEDVQWLALYWQPSCADGSDAAAGRSACADATARARFSVESADEAYAQGGATPPDVALVGPEAAGARPSAGALDGAQGWAGAPSPDFPFALVGCFASLPSEHRRVAQSGAAGGADVCHRLCVSEGYDLFLLGSGACYCVGAAVVDREIPADDLPTRACHGAGVRTYSLFRSLALGRTLGDAPASVRAAGEAAALASRGQYQPLAPAREWAPAGALLVAIGATLAALAKASQAEYERQEQFALREDTHAAQHRRYDKARAVMTFEEEIGVVAPLGFYDPLGLLDSADQERFERLRYVELKHGRICMLAVLGHVVTAAGIRLPGEISFGLPFADVPAGLKALEVVPAAGLAQIVAFVGFLELFVMKDVTGEGEFPGDFRNGYIDFGWDTFDDETKERKRNIELNQGRAAQMGILALMVHEKLDNNPYVINSLLGSPVPFN